jgi:hypothetical protein
VVHGGDASSSRAPRTPRRETGWDDIEPGPQLWTWGYDFTHNGQPTHQFERIFLGYGPRRDPQGDLSAAHAEDRILHGNGGHLLSWRTVRRRCGRHGLATPAPGVERQCDGITIGERKNASGIHENGFRLHDDRTIAGSGRRPEGTFLADPRASTSSTSSGSSLSDDACGNLIQIATKK